MCNENKDTARKRKAMQKLQTVNAETLLYEPLEKPSFVVDSLIPTGLSLFCALTEDRQQLAHAEAMLKRVAGKPLWICRQWRAMCFTSALRTRTAAYRTGYFV